MLSFGTHNELVANGIAQTDSKRYSTWDPFFPPMILVPRFDDRRHDRKHDGCQGEGPDPFGKAPA